MKKKERDKYLKTGTGIGIGLSVLIAAIYLASKKAHDPLEVVSGVDLEKYAGEWFEIARLPASFEKDCYKSKAYYSLNENGTVDVVNTCHKNGPDGKLKKSTGTAYVKKDENTNAKLKVQFQWPFKGDYQIIALGPDYEYAMVGTPSRKYLWILSRKPELDLTILMELVTRTKAQGFDTSDLIFTHQSKI